MPGTLGWVEFITFIIIGAIAHSVKGPGRTTVVPGLTVLISHVETTLLASITCHEDPGSRPFPEAGPGFLRRTESRMIVRLLCDCSSQRWALLGALLPASALASLRLWSCPIRPSHLCTTLRTVTT